MKENDSFLKDLFDSIIIVLASVSGFLGSMENIDLLLGIILKCTSILSFFVFLVINRSKILEEIKKIRKK